MIFFKMKYLFGNLVNPPQLDHLQVLLGDQRGLLNFLLQRVEGLVWAEDCVHFLVEVFVWLSHPVRRGSRDSLDDPYRSGYVGGRRQLFRP